MKQFATKSDTYKEVFEDDPEVIRILGEMTAILQTGAQRAGIPVLTVETLGVTKPPFPYRVWAGQLELPWDFVTRKAFTFLSRKLRRRWEILSAFVQDRADLGNTVEDDGGIGGRIGKYKGMDQGYYGEFVDAAGSASIYLEFEPYQYKGALTSAQVGYLAENDPFAAQPDSKWDRDPSDSLYYNGENTAHMAAVDRWMADTHSKEP